MTAVLLKGIFLLMSALVTTVTAWLSMQALADVRRVRKAGMNGAMRYMTLDNFRHQTALLGFSILLFGCALLTFDLDAKEAPYFTHYALPLFALLSGGALVDSLCTLKRRRRMAELVGDYMSSAMKGGRRKSDPPK